jgi:F0F1-type ATP synthase assembly protein I
VFALSDPLIAIIFFLLIMVASIWILVKESDKK